MISAWKKYYVCSENVKEDEKSKAFKALCTCGNMKKRFCILVGRLRINIFCFCLKFMCVKWTGVTILQNIGVNQFSISRHALAHMLVVNIVLCAENCLQHSFLDLTKRKFIKKIAGNPRKLPTKHVRPSFFTQFV